MGRFQYLVFLTLGLLAAGVQAQESRKGGQVDLLYNQSEAQRDIRLTNTSRINSPDLEFSPTLYHNGLVFVSRYKSGPVDEKTGETYLELFYSELDPNGMPTRPQNFSVELNSQKHEGPVSFNRKGDKIYFTRSNQQNGISKADKRARVQLKIYQATQGYYDWENITELPFNSDRYSCMHPALSPDEKKLFFASDMPGGYGGMDLYFVEKLEKGWSKPINLGPDVNTRKNEVFPFFHESGTLFFTSDGHQGLGGLDMYMIDISGRKWGRVINLGAPFNSINDDLGIILNERGTRGYFSSNREGGLGNDDVYMFEIPAGIKGIELPEQINTIVTVYDAEQSKRVIGAGVYLYERSDDGLIDNEELYNLELVPDDKVSGELNFKMVRKKDEQLGEPRVLTNRNGEAVLPLQANKNYLLMVTKPGYVSQEVVVKTPEEGPFRPIEVVLESSNCINLDGVVSSDKYNLLIPNALVKVVNECDGKVETTRTNINGAFQVCLTMGCDFNVSVEKEGYLAGFTSVSTVKIRGSRSANVEVKLSPKSDAVLKEPIRTGTVIVLENIYYDFNKSAIRTGQARDLEALARLMKQYPSMVIELGAHTDSRGAEDYNMDLSIKRAESARDFLVLRGVATERIKAAGYGESRPRNRCVDGVECSEEEHAYNRRTDVKVIKIDETAIIGYTPAGLEIKD